MSIYESIVPIRIDALLQEIHTHRAVLPDFQRDFVWDPAATQSLLISVANQYPAGSILRVRDAVNAFAVRGFEGAGDTTQRHTFLVLDGQQRLTSLYQSLYGVGDFRFFINLKAVLDEGQFTEDAIEFFRATRRGVIEKETNLQVQADEMIFPLSVLKKREGGFWKWVTDVRPLLESEQQEPFEASMRMLHEKWIQNFESYTFPVVTLTEEASTEALCVIFETLNKTGVKLTVFELLTAKFWKDGVNLRQKWDNTLALYPMFGEGDYDVEPYVLLQAVSLSASGSCQKKDVLNLTTAEIENHWDTVAQSLNKGLEILRDDCKVMSKKWMPTASMLGPMAAILAAVAGERGPAIGKRRQQVVRWFWCSVFGQRYEAAANTRGEKDVADMKTWFSDDNKIPEHIAHFRFDKELLHEVSSRTGSIYKGVICLTLGYGSGARDFHLRSLISQQMVKDNLVDDHHIFPRDFLKTNQGIERKSLQDCVLNKTLIDRTTNQTISNNAPSVYMQNIANIYSADTSSQVNLEDVLKSHMIPGSPQSPVWTDNYEEFRKQRADLIYAEIKRVTGLVDPQDNS